MQQLCSMEPLQLTVLSFNKVRNEVLARDVRHLIVEF